MPEPASAALEAGKQFHRENKFRESINSYDRAITLDPNYAMAYYNKGNSLAELGCGEEAIKSFDRAIALDPNDAMAYSSKGNSLAGLGRREEAIESYDRAIALNPNHTAAHNNRGTSLADLGRREEAIESYDRAIALNPNDALAHCKKGKSLMALDRNKEALLCFEVASALMEATNARLGLSQRNLSFIERTLNEHREKLLSQFCSFEASVCEVEEDWKNVDENEATVHVDATKTVPEPTETMESSLKRCKPL
jgi:tetratricopeptide (TPR) repeat protein